MFAETKQLLLSHRDFPPPLPLPLCPRPRTKIVKIFEGTKQLLLHHTDLSDDVCNIVADYHLGCYVSYCLEMGTMAEKVEKEFSRKLTADEKLELIKWQYNKDKTIFTNILAWWKTFL